MKENSVSAVKSVAAGVVLAFLLSILSLLIFAWVLYSSSVSETASSAVILVITLLSTFAGGFLCARMKKSRGLIFGALCGLVYFVILYIFSCFTGVRPDFDIPAVSTVIFGILTAALGGITAVNIKMKKR